MHYKSQFVFSFFLRQYRPSKKSALSHCCSSFWHVFFGCTLVLVWSWVPSSWSVLVWIWWWLAYQILPTSSPNLNNHVVPNPAMCHFFCVDAWIPAGSGSNDHQLETQTNCSPKEIRVRLAAVKNHRCWLPLWIFIEIQFTSV